jgi:predicted O-methyltransferase YrrM
MYSPFRLAKKYLRYYFTAANGKGHGMHSPFVFNFIIKVLNDKRHVDAYDKVEALRQKLLQDKTELTIEDFGAGSVVDKTSRRTIANIARHAAKPKKYAQLLFRIVQYYQPATILELGTSLGISTAYMAMGNPQAKLITGEGSSAIAAQARQNFRQLELQHIQVVEGNFDNTLPQLLQQLTTIDLAFIDGNHRLGPTLQYFQQLLPHTNEHSILIFDDIHWSQGMEQAWQQVKDHPAVTLSIDLFFIGLVFFRRDFKVKQHFIVRY